MQSYINKPQEEKPKRQFRGVWIPAELWLDKSLTITEKCFLVEINSLNGKNGCFASNNHFAEFFKLSKNRCSEIINSLEKKGYIKIKLIKKGKQIKKRIIRGVFEKSNRGSRKTEGGYSENREGNNTIYNNIIYNNTLSDFSSNYEKPSQENIKKQKNDPKYKTYLKFSQRLSDIISSHKKINCNSDIKSWVKPIRLLMTKDLKYNGVKFFKIKKRVRIVLDFYEDNIGGEYIPVIQSGSSFRKKFISLENAMERDSENYSKNTKPKSGSRLSDESIKNIRRKTIQIEN